LSPIDYMRAGINSLQYQLDVLRNHLDALVAELAGLHDDIIGIDQDGTDSARVPHDSTSSVRLPRHGTGSATRSAASMSVGPRRLRTPSPVRTHRVSFCTV
jgi:hypothetical protein